MIHLSKRVGVPFWQAMLIRVAAIFTGLIVCGLIAMLLIDDIKQDPTKIFKFYECFVEGAFSTTGRFWKYLKDTALLLCVALALTPAFRMRFWNIGGEGQVLMGVLASVVTAFYLKASVQSGAVPNWLLLIIMLAASLLAGIIWAIIPALFKAKWNTNETLFTLMMNYVAIEFVSFMLRIMVPNKTSLNPLTFIKFPVLWENEFLIIAISLLLAAGLFIYLRYSKHGYEISVVGESENTARYVGISVKKVILRTMIVSGALCGLTGYLIGAGLDHTVNTESAGGMGFTAIMVSWLAKFNPLFMILTSALIALLNTGAARISRALHVDGALPNVIVGVILFFIIGCEFFLNYQIHFTHAHAAQKEAVK